jgi:hypothetical protein
MFPIFRITKKNAAIPTSLPEIKVLSSMMTAPDVSAEKSAKLKKSINNVLKERGHRSYKAYNNKIFLLFNSFQISTVTSNSACINKHSRN